MGKIADALKKVNALKEKNNGFAMPFPDYSVILKQEHEEQEKLKHSFQVNTVLIYTFLIVIGALALYLSYMTNQEIKETKILNAKLSKEVTEYRNSVSQMEIQFTDY